MNQPTPAFPFEPQTAAFVARVSAQPPTEGLTLEQLRAGYRQNVIGDSVPADPAVETIDDRVASPGGDIPVRLYTPPAAVGATTALLLYVHGGGFAVGDLDSHDGLLRFVAQRLGHRVLALHYRRAPEHPYPAGRDDVMAVLAWARASGARLGIDPTRIAIGGESAGATHAAASAILARDEGLPPLRALWLLVPALDATCSADSYRAYATGAGRTATEFAYLWSLYVPAAEQRKQPGPSPLHAALGGLAPVFVYTAEFDPARGDGEAFVDRVRAAGGVAVAKRQTGLVHQFVEITGISSASRRAVEAAIDDLRAIL